MEVGIDIDEKKPQKNLIALIITIIELLVEALEKEAIRRMESDSLSEEEIEKLGNTLQSLEEEIERLKSTEEIEKEVEGLRKDLDEIVSNAIYQISDSENNFKNQ